MQPNLCGVSVIQAHLCDDDITQAHLCDDDAVAQAHLCDDDTSTQAHTSNAVTPMCRDCHTGSPVSMTPPHRRICMTMTLSHRRT